MIEVIAVTSKKQLKKFIDFPHKLYKGDENYVPDLYVSRKDFFDPAKNPFYQHAEIVLFLAEKNGKTVGRIAALVNQNYIEFTGNKWGTFGFFDTINDYEVAKALLEQATGWIKDKGMEMVTGPENFSTNDTCGVLIDGFNEPPMVMMTYNKSYYNDFLFQFGFEKYTDLLAYKLLTDDIPERFEKLADSTEKRLQKKGITIRHINMSKYDEEVDGIKAVYNSAWSQNLGFVPMTDAEFDHLAKDLKMLVDPDFVEIAEKDGKIIGFSLVIPDINQAFIRLKRGRLLPFGIFKLLYYKRKIDQTRIITLGVLDEYRKLGIDLCFYIKAFRTAKMKNVKYGEASWILKDNKMMNAALERINAHVYKKYRIYKYKL